MIRSARRFNRMSGSTQRLLERYWAKRDAMERTGRYKLSEWGMIRIATRNNFRAQEASR